jgi:hypothetical protein
MRRESWFGTITIDKVSPLRTFSFVGQFQFWFTGVMKINFLWDKWGSGCPSWGTVRIWWCCECRIQNTRDAFAIVSEMQKVQWRVGRVDWRRHSDPSTFMRRGWRKPIEPDEGVQPARRRRILSLCLARLVANLVLELYIPSKNPQDSNKDPRNARHRNPQSSFKRDLWWNRSLLEILYSRSRTHWAHSRERKLQFPSNRISPTILTFSLMKLTSSGSRFLTKMVFVITQLSTLTFSFVNFLVDN